MAFAKRTTNKKERDKVVRRQVVDAEIGQFVGINIPKEYQSGGVEIVRVNQVVEGTLVAVEQYPDWLSYEYDNDCILYAATVHELGANFFPIDANYAPALEALWLVGKNFHKSFWNLSATAGAWQRRLDLGDTPYQLAFETASTGRIWGAPATLTDDLIAKRITTARTKDGNVAMRTLLAAYDLAQMLGEALDTSYRTGFKAAYGRDYFQTPHVMPEGWNPRVDYLAKHENNKPSWDKAS